MVPVWFWAWLVVAAACAAHGLVGAHLLSLPFAFGALGAALATLVGTSISWQWAVFFGVSLAGLVGFGRRIRQR